MQLIQTQNPEVIKKLLPFWRKYLSKLPYPNEEAELAKFAGCFKIKSDFRLFVVVDENKQTIHGFCVLAFEAFEKSLMILQMGIRTMNNKQRNKIIEKLRELASKTGATAIYFYTERDKKAWEKLIKAKQIGYMFEIPMEGSNGKN